MGFGLENFILWIRTDVMEAIRKQHSQYIVTGAYANWLVNHSGLKYVLDAQVAVVKLAKEVKIFKGGMIFP